VAILVDRWRAERQRLAAHDENEPSRDAGAAPKAAPSELRRLADELELPVPDVDSALVDEIQRRRASITGATAPTAVSPPAAPQPAAHSVSRFSRALGGALAVVGILLVALGQPSAGALVLLVGVAVAAAGIVRRSRTRAPAAAPQVLVVPDQELPRLEARLALQQETQAQAQRRRDGANGRLAELGLPTDPDELRRLAAEADAATTAEARHMEWQRRRNDIEGSKSSAAAALRAALSVRDITTDDTDPEQAFATYTEQCRERAVVAREAARRSDVEAQLVSRRSAEASREQELASRAAAEQQLLDVARETGCESQSIDDLADVLRRWVSVQEELDEAWQHHERTAARLDQLLDGRTLVELEAESAELASGAGDPPPDDVQPLQDRSSELEELQLRVRERRELLAEFFGQIEGAEKHLLDVSVAIEAEARADAEVTRLSSLADDLGAASEILGAAQEKVHADIAPVLNETIRPWVPRITGGRYDDIRVNPATLEIEAHEAAGGFRAATVLSHGTTEQLFLLLRLALAQRLTTTGEMAPIILDDITVQSDTNRTVAAVELLHELSSKHQIVLFSQEDEVLRWAEERLTPPSDRLIQLSAPT